MTDTVPAIAETKPASLSSSFADCDLAFYLEREFARRSQWALFYIDLRFFRTYSQFYGAAAGTRMLAALRSLIVAQLGPDCNCYEVGAEALLAFSTSARAEADAAAICRRWQEERVYLYRPRDLERGFSIGSGRHGTVCRYPLVEVSIGLVDGGLRNDKCGFDLADVCSTALVTNAWARAQQRSTYVTERQMQQFSPLQLDDVTSSHYLRGSYAIAIEPDAALACLLQIRLELAGYDVRLATSVRAVTELVRDRIPDIAIADSDDPVALCRTLRQYPVLAKTLVVVLANEGNLLYLLEAGANIVMPKPFATEELLYWLQRLRPSPFKSMEFLPDTAHLGISDPSR